MKVLTMTFHTAKNYGAVLQCYALQQAIKKDVEDVETIDFSTETMRYRVLPKVNGLKSLIKMLLTIPYYKAIKNKFKKYDDFVANYIKLTRHYDSIEELNSAPPKADIIFTGSDQVFNPNRPKDERQAYYLDFPCEFRASFSASFGKSEIPENRKFEIKSYLEKFDALAVREEYAIEMVKKLHKCEVVHTIDPVFLLDKKEWELLEKEYHGIPKEYILFFNLRESATSIKIAQDLQKKTGLPIVMIIGKPNIPFKCKYVLRDVGPQNYLWLIHHCMYFIQDSFHATAFSLIYHKQFMFCDDHPKSYERGRALLNHVQLSEAYQYDEWEKILSTQYDYNKVDAIISAERFCSIQYINRCVEQAKINKFCN